MAGNIDRKPKIINFFCAFKAFKLPKLPGANHHHDSPRDRQYSNGQDHWQSSHRESLLSQDLGLTDTVTNFVDFVKEGRHPRHRYRHNMHTRYRGKSSSLHFKSKLFFYWHFKFYTFIQGSWSTSSSPVNSPSPSRRGKGSNGIYGTTSLEQRSRSPSPTQSRNNQFRGEFQAASSDSSIQFKQFIKSIF